MKIAAAIVTYNRLNLLKRCIDALKRQTYPIDEILIVNNSSTDGTESWLSTLNSIVAITQPNTGGAGGFKTAIQTLYNKGYDWIWVMDDDVFPCEDCLSILIKYIDKADCLQPYRYWSDNKLFKWYPIYDFNKAKTINFDFSNEVAEINSCCFEGMFINRKIISEVGFPDERFFIAGDDSSYGWRISQQGRILYIRDAIMIRSSKSSDVKNSPMYVYYSIRNYHLLIECIRDIGFNTFPFRFSILKNILFSIVSYAKKGDIKMIRVVFVALRDFGLKKTGKTY